MPLVLPAELPTADLVIVVPDDIGGRVVVFVDPRVPRLIANDTIAQVRRIIHSPGDVLARLAELVGGPPYALG